MEAGAVARGSSRTGTSGALEREVTRWNSACVLSARCGPNRLRHVQIEARKGHLTAPDNDWRFNTQRRARVDIHAPSERGEGERGGCRDREVNTTLPGADVHALRGPGRGENLLA